MSLAARAAALNPFGPIFGKELRVTSRKKRSYGLRVVYLGLLLLSLLMVYASEGRRYGGIAQQAQQQAELGAIFFCVFSVFCVFAMGLIPPVLTSTSIGSEKLAKTLPVLMMTPISTWQIVTGKLLSRLLAALTLLGLSLPVLALVRLLGGVELAQMVAVLCLCASFALSSAAVGLFFSTYINRAYAVILLSYATQLFLYLFVPMIVVFYLEATRSRPVGVLTFMFASHPVAAAIAMSAPDARVPVTVHWGTCCIVQVAFAAFLLTLSGLALRRVARRGGERAAAVAPEAYDPPSIIPMAATLAPSRTDHLQPPPVPVIPYRTASASSAKSIQSAREVSDNPILWREIRRPLLPRVWMRVVATIACLGLLLVTYVAMGSARDFSSPRHEEQIGFAIVFSGLFWLLIAVLSATAIASEKESDTWTLLLATPVSGSAVVWGKVAGLLRKLLWPTVLIAAHFMLFTVIGHVPALTTLYVLWVMFTFNSIWIATGIYLSLRMRRVTFAVITNLMLAVGAYAVVPAVLFVFSQLLDIRRNELVEQGIWHLPYMFLGNFLDGSSRYDYGYRYSDQYENYWLPGFHRVPMEGFLLATLAVGCIHLLASYLILSRTAGAFDEIVGRAGASLHGVEFDSEDAVTLSNSAGYAGFWRRAVAFGIDVSILQLGCGAIGLIVGAGVLMMADQSNMPPDEVLRRFFALGLLSSVLVGWPYYAFFESSRRRATPGKWLMGVFVTDADGRRIAFGRASVRYFSKLLSGLTLAVGYLMAAFTLRKRALHDMLANTLVLKR